MPYWSVAQCETHREPVAAQFLTATGFETYFPRIRASQRASPLFPGYLFVRIIDRWWSVNNTVGVIRLLNSGDQPARLKDEIVTSIKRQERNGFVKLPKPPGLRNGDKIRVVRGSFEGQIGIYEGSSSKDRERILLELLGRSVTVELNAKDFQPLQIA